MASKPILYSSASNAFDATLEHTFYFTWNGTPASNTIIIKRNSDNVTVYTNETVSLQMYSTVPADTLTNGVLYNVSIYVTDSGDNDSPTSDAILFYCFTTPTFELNITESQIITASSYTAEISYSQIEGETLQSYIITLYDSSQNELYNSNTRYSTSSGYILYGLDDSTTYYVRATGITLNGMELDTGYISFLAEYETNEGYAILIAENISSSGYIQLTTNYVSVEGHMEDEEIEPVFISSEYLDVTSNAVIFDEGFNIADDFSLALKFYGANENDMILKLTDNNGSVIELTYRKGTYDQNSNVEMTFIELIAKSNSLTYVIYSNFIDNPLATDILEMWIRKKDNIYYMELNNTSV